MKNPVSFTHRLSTAVLVLTFALVSCGPPSPAGVSGPSAMPPTSPSPSPSATPTPSAAPPAQLAVLITDWVSSPTYTLSLVGTDGRAVHSSHATTWSGYAAGQDTYDAGAAVTLPTSVTADRVYYLDGDTTLRYLEVNGGSGDAGQLPGSPTTRVAFSVRPDDSRIAVAVLTWSPTFTERSFVEDVGSDAHKVDLFSESTSVEEPMGWENGDIVYGVGLPTNQYNPGPALPTFDAYHLVDPSSGRRVESLCDGTARVHVFGHGSYTPLPTATGILCAVESPGGVAADLQVRSWSDDLVADLGVDGSCAQTGVASNQGVVALYTGTNSDRHGGLSCGAESLTVSASVGDRTLGPPVRPTGWLDETHLLGVPVSSAFSPPESELSELDIVDIQTGSIAVVPGLALFVGSVPSAL